MKLRKQEIVLIAALVLRVIITIWGLAVHRATLTVESELAPFEINLGNRQAECKSSPCSIKIKPRTYKATVQKTGYTEYNKEVTLERGDKVTLEYTPFPIPQLQPIETPEIISKAYMTTNERGDQVLMLRTEDRGDIVVSTFSNPLADPEVRVSPENDFAFVWDEASFPPAFFLVDINGKSKRVYPFGENKKPNDLEFLNSNQILIEREGQILLFDINLNDVFFYPIADLNHVLAFNNNQSLILSRSDLDEFAEPTADETDFFDIIGLDQHRRVSGIGQGVFQCAGAHAAAQVKDGPSLRQFARDQIGKRNQSRLRNYR